MPSLDSLPLAPRANGDWASPYLCAYQYYRSLREQESVCIAITGLKGYVNIAITSFKSNPPELCKSYEIPGPKTPRTDTILPEHLLAHTLIIYVCSHYCICSFCHHFPCKNDVLITSTQIEFSNPENIAVAYTNFLSTASCRIVNIEIFH